MDKEARDIANAFANAAKKEGNLFRPSTITKTFPTECSLRPGNMPGSAMKN